ncbi:hypothetical protein [Luteipulveratus mongoliensis]|uniref:Polysaccharide pyruvyl transferase domain-containing protein n=1 Tax=Luteipulveratus mongoliensis TaxID=571913 RepID=A0A0K1JHN1_9MICO|nr:hypothetical protein [Luteipulveratus mongoliensis]AKU16201.1 hypothetical protein VV02_10560 [Luteipulveratus mongoliensis]
MHHANHFYGHASILARYCGLTGSPTIWGYLQHGWNTHDGFAVGHEFVPGYPKLVWSEAVARRGWALGLRNYVVIGSPWAYLLALQAQAPPPEGERAGTLVYPFHGWEGQQIVGDHEAYADDVREREGDVPLTMCLYWNDYEDANVRKTYEDKGFRVITHGRRGHMYVGGDLDFLDRQLTEVRAHRRVVSNRLGSALLYGASTGAEIGVYGDPMVLEGDHAVLGGMAKQQRLFPELHQDQVPDAVAHAVARRELGLDETLSPTLLQHTLGWDDDMPPQPNQEHV